METPVNLPACTHESPDSSGRLSLAPWHRIGRVALQVLAPFAVAATTGLAMTGPAIAQFLASGDSSPAVTDLQNDLHRLGYPLTPDGVYGDGTAEAVARFQADHRLTVDGQVGPETRRALDLAIGRVSPTASQSGSPFLQQGNSSQDVLTLQQRLKANRYSVPTTGVFDAQTAQAVRQFQWDAKLPVDGIVGPQTWYALSNKPGTVSLPYVVVIPMDTGAKLSDVQQFAPNASEQRKSGLGPYIQASAHTNRKDAEFQAGLLKLRGFDAQVRRF